MAWINVDRAISQGFGLQGKSDSHEFYLTLRRRVLCVRLWVLWKGAGSEWTSFRNCKSCLMFLASEKPLSSNCLLMGFSLPQSTHEHLQELAFLNWKALFWKLKRLPRRPVVAAGSEFSVREVGVHSSKVARQLDPNQSVGLGGSEAPHNSGQCGLIPTFLAFLSITFIFRCSRSFDGSCSYVTLSILLSWPWPQAWEGSGERGSGGHLCVWKFQICLLFKWFKRGGIGYINW